VGWVVRAVGVVERWGGLPAPVRVGIGGWAVAVSVAGSAVSSSGVVVGGGSVGSRVAAVRRYWWVVLAVVWLAVVGGFVSSAMTPTTYVGRTSLIVSSNDRSPEQDAVLVQGYVSYFNNVPYQRQLLAEAGVDGDVVVAAEAAAASPIVVISATSDSAGAESAAIAVARVRKA